MDVIMDVIVHELVKVGIKFAIGIPLAIIGTGIIFYIRNKGGKK